MSWLDIRFDAFVATSFQLPRLVPRGAIFMCVFMCALGWLGAVGAWRGGAWPAFSVLQAQERTIVSADTERNEEMPEDEGKEEGMNTFPFAVVVDSIYAWPMELSAERVAALLPKDVSEEEKDLILETLKAMRAHDKDLRFLYSLYFQSLAASLEGDYAAGTAFAHWLDMQRAFALQSDRVLFQRATRRILRYFKTGIVYEDSSAMLVVADKGGMGFVYQGVVAVPVPSNEEAPSNQDALGAPTRETDLSTGGDAGWGDESGGDAGWGDEGGGDAGWGDEGGDDAGWGDESESQVDNDWDLTGTAKEVDNWGKDKDPYRQTATEFDRTELYARRQASLPLFPAFAGGPCLQLAGSTFKLYVKRKNDVDTLTLEAKQGFYTFQTNHLKAKGVDMAWPYAPKDASSAVSLSCEDLQIHMGVGRWQSASTALTVPYLAEEPVKGIFEARLRHKQGVYPVFRSFSHQLDLNLPYEQVSYTGGLSLKGDRFYGEAAAYQPGVLHIGDSTNIYLKAEARRFSFDTTRIHAPLARIAISYEGDDGRLQHPGMELKYYPDSLLRLVRHVPYTHSPFYDSYVGVYFGADIMNWRVDSDSLDFSLLQAQNRLPAVFKSDQYFSTASFSNMKGPLRFHPLILVTRFAKEAGTNDFLILDIARAYKTPVKQLHAALLHLDRQRYVDYDPDITAIHVLPRAFRAAFAGLGYSDYDHLRFASRIDSGTNASLSFDRRRLSVHGVDRVFFTTDGKVYARPDEGTLHLRKNKSFRFDGKVSSGAVVYVGKDFFFDYEGYKIEMPQIDSMRLEVNANVDTTSANQDSYVDEKREKVLNGGFIETKGTLFISPSNNRSFRKKDPRYPLFDSETRSDVYFDDPAILSGAYDRSVYFEAPPFNIERLTQADFTKIGFYGVFHSGDIMSPFNEKLSIMPDRSLGFDHEIQDESGYSLYNQPHSYIHGMVRMDLNGLQAKGMLEYQTSETYSDHFTFYPDKVVADVKKGNLRPGSLSGLENTSYPQAEYEQVRLLWRPKKDNYLLKTHGVPIRINNNLAQFRGTFNIRGTGTFGSGKLSSKGVNAESKYFHFKEKEYKARQANFEVLSDDPKKPAMRGKRIKLRYDFKENIGYMEAENPGIPSFDFPYMLMKTSMHEAVWDYEGKSVQMSHSSQTDSTSVFISMYPDKENFSFKAKEATYSMDSLQLRIEGVPYVRILGVDIVPEHNRVIVRENANIDAFQDATLYIDAENKFHTLRDGYIKIRSGTRFTGNANYQYTNADADTFLIKFNEFLVQEVRGDNGKETEAVVSTGVIPEAQLFKASAGFFFKGDVTMYSTRKRVILDGYVKLALEGEDHNSQWIRYRPDPEGGDIFIDFDGAVTEDGKPMSAGLHYKKDGALYLTFMQDKLGRDDVDLFEPEGALSYDIEKNFYVIREHEKKRKKASKKTPDVPLPVLDRKIFRYSPRTDEVFYEGLLGLMDKERNFKVKASAVGRADLKKKAFEMESFIVLDLNFPKALLEKMSSQMEDVRSVLPLTAATPSLNFDKLLSFIVGKKVVEKRIKGKLKGKAMYEIAPQMKADLVLSRVLLSWDPLNKSWYSTSGIQFSHTKYAEMNLDLKGYLKVTPREKGSDLDLLLYFAPSLWYHISYHNKNLRLYTSMADINALIRETTKDRSPQKGKYSFTLGKAGITDAFATQFSGSYNAEELDMKYVDAVLPVSNEGRAADRVPKKEDAGDTLPMPGDEALGTKEEEGDEEE